MDCPFPFARLPEEIQVRVLLNLEPPDILRFRKVSKSLSKLGDELAIRYKLQLDIAGMVDNPHHGSSMIERFRTLLQYEEGWSKIVPTADPNIPSPIPRDLMFSLYWQVPGGVFPYIVNSQPSQQQTLHLYRPGSPMRGLKPQKWIVEPSVLPGGYRYLGCGIDVAQDLLVLSLVPLRYDPESDEVCILQLQSLGRPGVAHPHASQHILRGLTLRTDDPVAQTVQICENMVACAICQDEWEVELWGWKTGMLRMRLRLARLSFYGCALLTPSYLLLLAKSRTERSLSAYWLPPLDYAPDSSPRILQNNDCPDVVLKLVPFSERVNYVLTYLLHSRETASRPDDNPLFEYNPDLTILTLFFRIYTEDPDDEEPGAVHMRQFLLIASVREIVRTLDRVRASLDGSQPPPLDTVEPRIIEWDEWGPPSTRLIGLGYPMWNDVPTTSRTRCALAFQGTRSGDGHFDYLFVINAHPYAALAPGPGYAADEETASFLVYSDVFTAPDVLREPVRSSLPINVSCRRLPHNPAPYLGIGLFEDGLSIMYLFEPDSAIPGEMFIFCV